MLGGEEKESNVCKLSQTLDGDTYSFSPNGKPVVVVGWVSVQSGDGGMG